jgi:hypothetical protein
VGIGIEGERKGIKIKDESEEGNRKWRKRGVEGDRKGEGRSASEMEREGRVEKEGERERESGWSVVNGQGRLREKEEQERKLHRHINLEEKKKLARYTMTLEGIEMGDLIIMTINSHRYTNTWLQ